MKLRTKLVISFVTMIMIPTILTTAFIFGIARYQIGVIEHTYGITGEEYKDFAKSIRVLGDMPEIQQFIISACIAVVLILAFTAMIMMVWIYGSIISPIHKLQPIPFPFAAICVSKVIPSRISSTPISTRK